MNRLYFIVESPFTDIRVEEFSDRQVAVSDDQKILDLLKGKPGSVLIVRETNWDGERRTRSARIQVQYTLDGLTEFKHIPLNGEGKEETWYLLDQKPQIAFSKDTERSGEEVTVTFKARIVGQSLDDFRGDYIFELSGPQQIGHGTSYFALPRWFVEKTTRSEFG